MDRFRAGRGRRAGGHDGHRGRRRRAQRDRDGRARRRPLRHRPAPPAPGPGRPGRAPRRTCYLVSGAPTPEAEARLAAMVRTTDGFELAEVDLDLRGEGTIMGERQKGRNDLKLASLRRDREWVEPGPRGRLRAGRRRPRPGRPPAAARRARAVPRPRGRGVPAQGLTSGRNHQDLDLAASGPEADDRRLGRPVAIVAFDGFQLLDLAGPADVFRAATLLGADPAYEVRTVGAGRRSVASDSGIDLTADARRSAADVDPIDTLVVVGGLGVRRRRARPRPSSSGCAALAGRAQADHVGVHRRVRARRGRAARRPPGHDPLGVRATRSPTRHPAGRGRAPTASTCTTATAGPRPASPPASTSRSPSSRTTTAPSSPTPSPGWLVVFVRRPGGQAQFSAQLAARPARTAADRRAAALAARPPRRGPLGPGARRAAPR